jgi:hypothetical protein
MKANHREGEQMLRKDEYVAKLEKQLARWSAQVDRLMEKALELGDEARHSAQMRIDDGKVKLAAARQKVDALKIVGSERYEHSKTALESFWKEAKAAFERG